MMTSCSHPGEYVSLRQGLSDSGPPDKGAVTGASVAWINRLFHFILLHAIMSLERISKVIYSPSDLFLKVSTQPVIQQGQKMPLIDFR